MTQGQFTSADLQSNAPTVGAFTLADLDKPPVTMNAKRGGSSVTSVPTLHGSDLLPGGVPGAAEKAMGEGRTRGEIISDSAKAPLMGAAVVAPMLTGGASLPVQAAVSGLSGAAQAKLTGASNAETGVAGAIGAAIPYVGAAAKGMLGRIVDYFSEHPELEEAIFPQKPPQEVLQARGLAEGGKPVREPADALGKIPVKSLFEVNPEAANQAIKELGPTAPLKDLTSRANEIEQLLNQGMGGKPLAPNVPLKEQMQAAQASPGALPVKSTTRTAQGIDTAATSKPTSELPEPQPRNAPEPRESTAVQDFKYDPDAKEMHIQWKGNPPRTYVYGEVTPEQAQIFHAAESKGMAAKSIKDNNPYVAKIIDGKRIAVKAAKNEADFISPEEWQAGQEMETQVEGTPRR